MVCRQYSTIHRITRQIRIALGCLPVLRRQAIEAPVIPNLIQNLWGRGAGAECGLA